MVNKEMQRQKSERFSVAVIEEDESEVTRSNSVMEKFEGRQVRSCVWVRW